MSVHPTQAQDALPSGSQEPSRTEPPTLADDRRTLIAEERGRRVGPYSIEELAECVRLGYLTSGARLILPDSGEGLDSSLGEMIGRRSPGNPTDSTRMTHRSFRPSASVADAADGFNAAESVNDAIKQASEAMEKWSEVAAKAGNNATRLDRLVEGVTAFSRFSVAFGLAGAALGLVSTALQLFQPDPQKQMLDMLTRLSESIQNLREELNTRLKAIAGLIQLDSARVNLMESIDKIDAKMRLMRSMAEAASLLQGENVDGEAQTNAKYDLKVARDHLLASDHTEMWDAATAIVNRCIPMKGEWNINFIEALYDNSHGDLNLILPTGACLAGYVAAAAQIDNLILQLQSQAKGDSASTQPSLADLYATVAAVQRLYQRLQDGLGAALGGIRDRARRELDANIEGHLDAIVTRASLPAGRFRFAGLAQSIRKQLSDSHGWCAFYVLVYEAECGPHKSGCVRNGRAGMKWYPARSFPPSGNKAVVHVSWFERREANPPPPKAAAVAEITSWCRSVIAKFHPKAAPPWGPRAHAYCKDSIKRWPDLWLDTDGNPGLDRVRESKHYFEMAVGLFAQYHGTHADTEAGSPMLTVTDVSDGSLLAERLKTPADGVSSYVRDQLRKAATDMLDAWQGHGSLPELLSMMLVEDLNSMIAGDSIWDATRFQSVDLRAETTALRDSQPTGSELARLNRLLLDDAYPKELARTSQRSFVAFGAYAVELFGDCSDPDALFVFSTPDSHRCASVFIDPEDLRGPSGILPAADVTGAG